jgi:hypothetical protein
MFTLFSIGALIIGLVLVGGILRFLLRVAWRIISLVLTLAVILGVVLFFLGYIHIH